jgi:protease II
LYQSTQNRKCQRTERSIPINETNYTYPTSRIGNTNYRFKVRFSQDAEETLEEKVVRLIRKNLLTVHDCDTMNLSQTNCPPERSSL